MNIDETKVAIIKGMVRRGDRQMDVALWAQVNQARVNEIVHGKRSGKRWAHVKPAPLDQLPDPGPYDIVSRVKHDRMLRDQAIVAELEVLLKRYKDSLMTG